MSAVNPLPPTPRDTGVEAVRLGVRCQTMLAVMWLSYALLPVVVALIVRRRAPGEIWLIALAPALVLLAFAARALLRRGHVARIYRDGAPATATVKDSYFLQRRYFVLEVQTDDGLRRATIVGHGRPKQGLRLQALVHRDWVGVIVQGVGLSVGRLRR